MPAMDVENDTAETTADISAAASVSTAAVNLGLGGLAKAEGFAVAVTAKSDANFNTDVTRKLNFYCEVTVDNGTTWRRVGVIAGRISAAGVPLQGPLWGPIEAETLPELYASADVDWRVTADWTNVLASADDFNFKGWIGNQNLGIRVGLVN